MANQKLKINIPDPVEVFNECYIPHITEAKETNKHITVIEGGRGSGKSKAIVQRLVLSSLKRKMRICLMRKIANTIRDSQYKEISDTVYEWELGDHFNFNKSHLEIKNLVGSEFICKGLDKFSKIKSLAGIDILWIEEATELTAEDWETVVLTIRGDTKYELPRQIILSFNRTLGNWTEKKFFNADGSFKKKNNIYHLHTTFQDNKFLNPEYINYLNQLKEDDPDLYKKNALGLPVALKGIIFQNWKEVEEFPENVNEVIYGLDFGVHDPTVLVKLGIKDHDVYIDELIYKSGLTNQNLRSLLPELLQDKTLEIYADSEDTNRIEEIYSDGFNIHPANKGTKSVIEGIALMRSYNLHITARSTSLKKDFENYKWKTDKNGNSVVPETPMHAFSHGCDAVRYPIYTHLYNAIKPAMQHIKTKDENQIVIKKRNTIHEEQSRNFGGQRMKRSF